MMSLPKSWRGIRIGRVAPQTDRSGTSSRRHRCPCWPAPMSGLPGMRGGFFGFSRKAMMLFFVVDMHHAEAGRFLQRHLEAADRHVGALIDVLLQHHLVVHLVE